MFTVRPTFPLFLMVSSLSAQQPSTGVVPLPFPIINSSRRVSRAVTRFLNDRPSGARLKSAEQPHAEILISVVGPVWRPVQAVE
jgi:hypothetical protein